jgi:hypothetical protein
MSRRKPEFGAESGGRKAAGASREGSQQLLMVHLEPALKVVQITKIIGASGVLRRPRPQVYTEFAISCVCTLVGSF